MNAALCLQQALSRKKPSAVRPLYFVIALLGAAACQRSDSSAGSDTIRAVADLTPCVAPIDSLRLARIALDTVTTIYRARGTPFESTIRRFEPDSAAGIIRITTVPRPRDRQDLRAIALLDCEGRVFELILTDTANAPEA